MRPPRPGRQSQLQKDMDEVAATGRTSWRPVPRDKHILRMYISAGLSVFVDVMRHHLEQKLGRLMVSFVEAVEAMLPYWDGLVQESRDGWCRRAKDVGIKNHYIYLRMPSNAPKPKKMAKEPEMEDYDTDPDEMPGVVCPETLLVEEKILSAKPLNWGGRHLMPRKTPVR